MTNEEKISQGPEELKQKIKEAKAKGNAMITGVAFFMILIFVLWIFNFKMFLARPTSKTGLGINIDELSNSFSQEFQSVSAKLSNLSSTSTIEAIRRDLSTSTPAGIATSTSTSTAAGISFGK